ncbi:MAG TPA: RtcB family protein [Gaiellales bacterium]|nr:RtcB family protein [Gaiellales bacterium]
MGVINVPTAPLTPVESGDVRVFDSPDLPADPVGLGVLAAGVRGADLAAPAIALPDFHFKADKEMPSSIAVATRSTIRPTCSSASLNCGMSLVALDVERPSNEAVADFFRRFRERYPYPPGSRRDLTEREVVRAAADGAAFAVERFGVSGDDVARVELGGRLDVDRFGGAERVRRELPWSVRQVSRMRFGTIGPSNHFVELQEVVDVFDPWAAARLGLVLGQVTLQFHGGGGSLPGELGLLFARRRRYPRAVRLQMCVQKPLYHYGRARSVSRLRRRRALYFTEPAPPVERESAEGERVALANAMAMNYGFAFRLSTLATMRPLLAASLGVRDGRLVVDTVHNSIYEEPVGGEPAIVHRHNACRIFPAEALPRHPAFAETGQPLLLPGTNRTSSYVCLPSARAAAALHTVCHGAGTVVSELARRPNATACAPARHTLRFGYRAEEPLAIPHLPDDGVDAVVRALQRHGIVRPIVRLRPFAVLN